MNENKCKDCEFWTASETATEGQCRKYAPKPTLQESKWATTWPITLASDFCGEFHHRQPENNRPATFT